MDDFTFSRLIYAAICIAVLFYLRTDEYRFSKTVRRVITIVAIGVIFWAGIVTILSVMQ